MNDNEKATARFNQLEVIMMSVLEHGRRLTQIIMDDTARATVASEVGCYISAVVYNRDGRPTLYYANQYNFTNGVDSGYITKHVCGAMVVSMHAAFIPHPLSCDNPMVRGYIVDIDGITVVIAVSGFINVGYNSYLAKSCMEKLARKLGLKNGSPEFDMREAVIVGKPE